MSIQAVAWAISQKVGSPTGKVLLICLANYADEEGLCWPSQKTIAAETELSDRSTILWLKKLEECGYIQRERRHRRDGSRTTDHIRLQLQQRPQTANKDLPADSAGRSELGAFDAKPTCISAQSNLQEMHPNEPSEKPSIEPPSSGARAREVGGFDDLWSGWPEDQRPDKRKAAEHVFKRLPPENQIEAVRNAAAFRRLCKARKELALMIPYLKNRSFMELVDGPKIDTEGRFVFTPDRPEWPYWISYLQRKYSDKATESLMKSGYFVEARRWPPRISQTGAA
ncbi:helix-turn-helix domain-containing protein [Ahrensia kielensis]|uniref:Helix-turn-helix domain-containing protein n=1 Tax=Ahrensia kielensis TaxID=76980 RepID=A0ABU9T6S5_9HYPH